MENTHPIYLVKKKIQLIGCQVIMNSDGEVCVYIFLYIYIDVFGNIVQYGCFFLPVCKDEQN